MLMLCEGDFRPVAHRSFTRCCQLFHQRCNGSMVLSDRGAAGANGGGEKRRRQWWLRSLLGLAVMSSALYVLLYNSVSISSYRLSSFTVSHCDNVFFSPPFKRSHTFQHRHNRAFFSFTSPSHQTNSSTAPSMLETDNRGGRGAGWEGGGGVPLLTLFTTWVNRDDLKLVRKLTLRNWGQLRPLVRTVLFSNDSVMVEQARQSGWDTLPVSRTAIGIPILKNMYLDAMSRFNSTLYAYANGDILFMGGLLNSLTAILRDPALPLGQHPILAIGRRTNVKNVTDEEALNFSNISRVAKQRGKLFIADAEDFFITDTKFPWDCIPDLVVGRIGYDNWLVLEAIRNQYVVVDITQTCMAVHQTTNKGNYEGSKYSNPQYNLKMLKQMQQKINYERGRTDCSIWRTEFQSGGKVVVVRAKRHKRCKP